MSKLAPLKPEEVVRKRRKLGFSGPIPGGKHVRMYHPESGKIIPIPMYKGKDVSTGVIREVINELEISREEWLKL
jgi:predicted RNA binding protein YcfA (HicA-like mRNA interferase family)